MARASPEACRARRAAVAASLLAALSTGSALAAPPGALRMPAATEDAALEDALVQQARGRPLRAEAALRRLAEQGSVAAMERLALMHWYGSTLQPGTATRWSRATSRHWFGLAAARGSALGQQMSGVTDPRRGSIPRGRPREAPPPPPSLPPAIVDIDVEPDIWRYHPG